MHSSDPASTASLRRSSSATGPGPAPPRASTRSGSPASRPSATSWRRAARAPTRAARGGAARLLRARRGPREHAATTRCRRARSSRSCRPSPGDDGRMPRVDDQPTDVSPERSPTPVEAPAAVATPSDAGSAPGRRRPRHPHRRPAPPPRPSRGHPQGAGAPRPGHRAPRPSPSSRPSSSPALLVLALLADPVLLAAGLAWAGIVVAWGWPALLGSSSRFGSSLAIGVTGRARPGRRGGDHRRALPAAACRWRSSSGSRSCSGTRSCAVTAAPGSPSRSASPRSASRSIALGTTWMPLSRNDRATEIAVVGVRRRSRSASLADLVRRRSRRCGPGCCRSRCCSVARGRRRGRRDRGRRRRARPPWSGSSAPRSRTAPAGCSACCRRSPRCAASCRPPRHPCSCPVSWPTGSLPSSARRLTARSSASQ